MKNPCQALSFTVIGTDTQQVVNCHTSDVYFGNILSTLAIFLKSSSKHLQGTCNLPRNIALKV